MTQKSETRTYAVRLYFGGQCIESSPTNDLHKAQKLCEDARAAGLVPTLIRIKTVTEIVES